MRTRLLLLVAATLAAVATACSGSPTVAEVNGASITADEVSALRADPSAFSAVEGEPFRADLGVLIVNAALRTAAEDQFGVSGVTDPDLLAARIAEAPGDQASLFAAIDADPERTSQFAENVAQFFLIRDAVLAEIASDGDLDEAMRQDRFNEWVVATIEAAEIEVRSQVGVWGGLGPGVLPPP